GIVRVALASPSASVKANRSMEPVEVENRTRTFSTGSPSRSTTKASTEAKPSEVSVTRTVLGLTLTLRSPMAPGRVSACPLRLLATLATLARTSTSVPCCLTGYLMQVIASPGCGEIGSPVCGTNCDVSHGASAFVVELLEMAMLQDGSEGSQRQRPPP